MVGDNPAFECKQPSITLWPCPKLLVRADLSLCYWRKKPLFRLSSALTACLTTIIMAQKRLELRQTTQAIAWSHQTLYFNAAFIRVRDNCGARLRVADVDVER